MNSKQLENKVNEGIRRAYDEAQSVYPRVVSWNEINTPEVAEICKGRGFIWAGFYLPKAQFDQIVKDLSKGTRYSWRWPRRTEIGEDGKIVPDPEWDEYHAAYEAKSKEFEEKKITLKEFNAWRNEMGKKYGMQRRNYDREAIEFNIWNVAPTTDADKFLEVAHAYKDLVLGHTPEEAAKRSIAEVTWEDVLQEYDKRVALVQKYNSSEDFQKDFLDKEKIRETLEDSYENRVNSVAKTISMLKDVWDKIFSKK